MPYWNPYKSYNLRVRKEGLGYHIRNRASVRKFGSTYLDVAVNEATNSLTESRVKAKATEKVKLELPQKEHNSIDSSILLYSFTVLELIGRITLANGANCDMLKNDATETSIRNVTVQGGYWYGNAGNQTAESNGIHLEISSEPSDQCGKNRIRDMRLYGCRDNDIWIENSVGISFPYEISDLFAWGAETLSSSCALRMEGVIDSWVHHLDLGGTTNFIMQPSSGGTPCGANYVHDVVCIGASSPYHNVIIGATRYSQFSRFNVEAADNQPVSLEGAKFCNFNTWRIRKCNNGNDTTYSAVLLQTNPTYSTWKCIRNNFSDFNIHPDSGVTGRFKYGLEENDSDQDYNIYSVVNAKNGAAGEPTSSGAIKKLGTNSLADTDTIIGSVV